MSNYEELIRPEFEVQCQKLGRGIERGVHSGEYASLPTYDAWEELKAVVAPLLVALEEKDQELDKEGDILIDTQESMREWRQRANAAEQLEVHLKAAVDVLSAKNAELQQRLQQPIATQQGMEIIKEAIGAHGFIVASLVQGRPDLALEESRKWVAAFSQAAEQVDGE